jgi:hypothetical protein
VVSGVVLWIAGGVGLDCVIWRSTRTIVGPQHNGNVSICVVRCYM